jgi:tRNA-binding EMAP/Myf-like protein
VDDLTTTQGIAVLAAGGVAMAALVLAAVLAVKVRRLRRGQTAVLGATGTTDLVAHAAALQEDFRALRDWVEDMGESLDARMRAAEERLDGAIAYRALVRYDAYNEMSGRQSTSLALLDARRSGVVVSSIHHREQARLYVKQVHDGEGELELSPEEAEAVSLALAPASAPG